MNIKLEKLKNRILEYKQDSRDHYIENLQESTEFTRGVFFGADRTYDEISDMLGIIIKYGDN